MTENQTTYEIDTGLAVTKTYSLTLAHIAMVSDLAKRLNTSQGDIVRTAIEFYYKQMQDNNDEN